MKTRNNIMILDTETVGSTGHPFIHDFGYVIVDRNFNVLKKDRYLVKEFHKWAHAFLDNNQFYNQYTHDYEQAEETEKILTWSEISKIVSRETVKYNVNVISAYNLAFDLKAIENTEKLFNRGTLYLSKTIHQKSKYLLDIWNLACETICVTDEYYQFCKENNAFSKCGNIKTNAETVYRFIFNNYVYNEKHTALSDSEDEMQILKYIVNNEKKKKFPNYGLYYNCWRKAQKKH